MSRPVRVLLLVAALLLAGSGPATAAPAVPAPTVTEAVALSDTAIRVSWTPVDRATSYELRWSVYGEVAGSLSSTSTTATFAAASSTDHVVEVRALRSSRTSGWSAPALVRTPPAAPTGVTGSGVRPDLVELSWTRELSTLAYEVFEVAADGALVGPVAQVPQGWDASTTAPSSAATTTAYAVVAVDEGGLRSTPSTPVEVTTPDLWPSEVVVFVHGPFDEGAVDLQAAVVTHPEDRWGTVGGTLTFSAAGIEPVTVPGGSGGTAALPLPAGTHDVTVAFSGDTAYLPSSTVVRIEVRPAVAAFLPGRPLPSAGYQLDTAVADVTGDGVVDVVATVPTDATTGRLALWRGLGDGAFADPVLTAVPEAGQLAVGDLDRDGDADAVVAATSGLVVALGGPGGLGAPTTKRVTGTPVDVAVGDVTADGIADVVVGTTAGLQVLPGNGRGGWGKAQVVSTATATGLVLGDTTGDGRPEVAGWTGAIEVWTRPASTWSRLLQEEAPGADGDLALGDVTGDGRADLAWTAYPQDGSWGEQLHLRVSQGTAFAATQDLARSYTEQGLAVGDLTGDGLDDVVSGASGYPWLSVWRVAPDGTATPPARVASGETSLTTVQLLVADLDGDGRDDVLHVGHDGALVLRRA
jgi:hypothetical protein